MRRVLLPVLSVLAVGAISGCGDRSETDASEEFVSAFNNSSLADRRDLFEPQMSQEQLQTLTALGKDCSLDPESLAVVETGITPYLKTFGTIADCDGKQYSIIAGLSLDCSTGPDCEYDYMINPDTLPGGADPGSIDSNSLPQEIRRLEPLRHAPE